MFAKQISASPFPGLPLYFTEWSTSYTPRDSVHDSYISAPYILTKLKASQGLAAGNELLDLHRSVSKNPDLRRRRFKEDSGC